MIIFDEKQYAEELIKNGYKNKKYITYDNIILVKYWKHQGLDTNQIKDKLQKFMVDFENLFSGANIISHKIKKAMDVGMKYDLLTDISVRITQGELDCINQLPSIETRKMMFVLLVVWKGRGSPKRFKISNTDLMKLSGVRTTSSDVFWNYIYQITQSNMLSMVEYKNKSYYTINIKECGNIVLNIKCFDCAIDYYLQLIEPDRYKQCEICNVPILITKPKRKYCYTCGKIVDQSKAKDRMQNIRSVRNKKNYKV